MSCCTPQSRRTVKRAWRMAMLVKANFDRHCISHPKVFRTPTVDKVMRWQRMISAAKSQQYHGAVTLRKVLSTKHATYVERMQAGEMELDSDASFGQLDEDQRKTIRAKCEIIAVEPLKIATQDELVAAIQSYPVSSWDDRIDALSGRFNRARESAAKYLVPETRTVDLPRSVLADEAAVDEWIAKVGALLREEIGKGPVVLR